MIDCLPETSAAANRQFLAMAEAFASGRWGRPSAWLLLEMDCRPRRSAWLSALLDEVAARAPFAVLGSFFRGDAWDGLPMPPAIQHHINGGQSVV